MNKSKLNLIFSILLINAFLTLLANADIKNSRKKIVTTFTIIEDIAQNVAGNVADVVSITKPGAEIHDYEPTPLDIVKTQSADLVLWNGLGLERWFEKFFQNIKNVESIIVSDGVVPINIEEGPYVNKPNPHAWMSPKNILIYVENIKNALIKIDPINKDVYINNADKYSAMIKEVDLQLNQILSKIPADKKWLVTSEGAFSYLAKDYGLNELFLWAVNADEEGTPRQIQKVIDVIKQNKIPVVFSESTISNKAILQVSSETNTKYGGVLYVDSLTDATGEVPTFLDLLKFNANTIANGFSQIK
jgi:manganese/iron transport system substrate-binding protein